MCFLMNAVRVVRRKPHEFEAVSWLLAPPVAQLELKRRRVPEQQFGSAHLLLVSRALFSGCQAVMQLAGNVME